MARGAMLLGFLLAERLGWPMDDTGQKRSPHAAAEFATTQWSMVLRAGRRDEAGREALARLCASYWYPLYAYVRRRVNDPHEARDLTQAFFAELLERESLAAADPDRGRFRAFLLTAFKHFLANVWQRAQAAKRGGAANVLSLDFEAGESRWQLEPAHDATPERMFERRWVLTLLDQVLADLQAECAAAGQAEHFAALKEGLLGEATAESYGRAAASLGLTPAAAKQAAYRLRRRFRALFRREVARTVGDASEVDDEIARLLAILRD